MKRIQASCILFRFLQPALAAKEDMPPGSVSRASANATYAAAKILAALLSNPQ